MRMRSVQSDKHAPSKSGAAEAGRLSVMKAAMPMPCTRVSCHAAMPSQLLSQLDRLAKHGDGRLLARAAVQPLRLLACLEHIEHALHAR